MKRLLLVMGMVGCGGPTLGEVDANVALNPRGEVWAASLRDSNVTATWLVHLKKLPELSDLSLPKKITDAGLVHVAGLMDLVELNLSFTPITDAGTADLQKA
tara:strand:+ start:117 stop:422 length:306 start_codon:yes stop_codon:yes gene_type:complete